jgi:hypothetical protein
MTQQRVGDAYEQSILVSSIEAPDSDYVLFVEVLNLPEGDSARMYLDDDDVESLKKAIQRVGRDNG